MTADQSKKQFSTAAKPAVLMCAVGAATMCFIGSNAYAQRSAPVPGVKTGDKIPSIATVDQLGHPPSSRACAAGMASSCSSLDPPIGARTAKDI